VVHNDTDSGGVFRCHASSLDLCDGEAASKAEFGAVALRLAAHGRAEFLEGAGGDFGGLGGARESAGLLLGCLVEVETDLEGATGRLEVLLVAMDVGDDVVVLYHLGPFLFVFPPLF